MRLTSVESHQEEEVRAPTGMPTSTVFFNRTDLIDKPTGINRIPFRSLIKPLFRALSNSGYRRGGSGEQRTRTILIAEVHGLCLCYVELCLHCPLTSSTASPFRLLSPSNSDDGYQDTGPSSSRRNWVVSDENDETRGFSIKSPKEFLESRGSFIRYPITLRSPRRRRTEGTGIEASVDFGIESSSLDARDGVDRVFIRNNEASRDA
ncbi:hypothetical protein V1478_006670 [Vespula squamosa]|uniref:Uncharacterized protein n=1 Tax=Vespula squamosa TaxID=30214 RepID=A0ABD2B8I1_VESSQ